MIRELKRTAVIAILISALASCATERGAMTRDPMETTEASAGGAIAAGLLIKATEVKRIPARKPRAMLAIASPLVLDRAIDMSVLEGVGYANWRDERGDGLHDVKRIRISFLARLPEGGLDRQSGMLFLPVPRSGESAKLTWIVFLRWTEHLRDEVPSREGGSERTLMEAAAALGYAVWAPDYAGAGDSAGAQEYCVPESMAASALDGLAAARSYLADGHRSRYAETGRLAVLGYSQGGLAAMSTLRALSDGSIPVPGLRLAAGYALGAPLDLLIGVPFREEGGSVVARPDYSVLLAMGWARAYPDSIKLEEILLPGVVANVVPLFDGLRDGDELCKLIAEAVGKKTGEVLDSDLYRPEYLSALGTAPDTVPLYAAQDEYRLDRWTPPADYPIVIAASPDDEIVPFGNSAGAYGWIKEKNPAADVSLVRLASDSHGRAGLEGLLYALVDIDKREREE